MLQTLERLHAAGVPGAQALAERVKQAEAASISMPVSQRESQNWWTEAFAVGFAKDFLGYSIVRIEQDGDVLSPHRIGNKSCDMLCMDEQGHEVFVETKDNSGDLLRAEASGPSGFTPQLETQVNRWIAAKVTDSINKGAHLLIARIPVWSSALQSPEKEDINFEIFRDRELRDEIPLRLDISIPPHFRGIWFFKNGSEMFYKVRRVNQE